jgi:hypothetical protein
MTHFVERRKYRRFEIPGGTVKLGKTPGYPSLFKPPSKTYPLMNACIGGINILCSMALNTGEDFLLELQAPGEKAVKLRSRVIWTNPVPLSKDILTGFELFTFGENRDQNPPETMGVLRRLYARYIDA